MSVLSNLDERLENGTLDADAYSRNLEVATEAARQMHLVHVTGTINNDEEWEVFLSILREPPHEIPTSENHVYCSDETRKAEDCIGFPRSVYFYAGRAHPDFGSLALAFTPDCQDGCTGSATPFDSGGLVLQPVPPVKLRLEPDDLTTRIQYCKQSVLPLDQWRTNFGKILAAYFSELAHYWTGRPGHLDPEGLYQAANEWRAWTFEVRLAEPQPIRSCAAWCADESVMHLLFRLQQTELTSPGAARPVGDFLRSAPALVTRGMLSFCQVIELWVQERLGI